MKLWTYILVFIFCGCSSSSITKATEDNGGASNGGESSMGGSSIIGKTSQGGNNSGIGGGIEAPSFGGNTVCKAKICPEIAAEIIKWTNYSDVSAPVACGLVNDSCGNLINCGECPGSATNTGCGESLRTSGNELFPIATPNICGSRCYKQTNMGDQCKDTYGYSGQDMWICATAAVPIVGKINCHTISGNAFCCDAS